MCSLDKPDLGFVVHLGAPSSSAGGLLPAGGRAGRATERADVLLMPGVEDRDIWTYFASVSMPREDQAGAVLTALTQAGRALSTAVRNVGTLVLDLFWLPVPL